MKNKLKKLIESDVAFAVIVAAMGIDAVFGMIYGNYSMLLSVLGIVCCVTGIAMLAVKKHLDNKNKIE